MRYPRIHDRLLGMATAAVLLAACAQPAGVAPATQAPSLKLDAAGVTEQLAAPLVFDWSSRVIVSEEAERLKRSRPARGDRRIQALAATHVAGDGFASSAAAGRISAPAYNAETNQLFWVAENGWLLRRDLATGQEAAFPLSAVDGTVPTDTFPHTEVTLSKDGARVYLCSAQGHMFALDSQTGKNLINSPYAMGESVAEVGFVPAPMVDVAAGSKQGDEETVYAISNLGTLHRFYVDGRGVNAAPYLMHAQSYAIAGWRPWGNPPVAVGEFLYPLSPVAINGRILITRRYKETHTWQGVPRPAAVDWPGVTYANTDLLYYDTGVQKPTMAPQAGRYLDITPGITWTPYARPPAVHVDKKLNPYLTFVSHGAQVYMIGVEDFSGDALYPLSTQSYTMWVRNDSPDSGPQPYGGRDDLSVVIPSAVTLDPVGQRAFTVVGNALFQLPYDSATNSPMAGMVDLQQRMETFGNFRNHTFAKTAQGRATGTEVNHVNIMNVSPPYFDGTHVWVLDQNDQPGRSTRVMLNRFLPGDGAAPTLVESIDLTALAPDAAQIGEGAIALDPLTQGLFLTTATSAGPAKSRLWSIAP